MGLEQIFTAVLPDIQNMLGLVLTAVASWAAYELKKRFGVDIKIKELDKETQLRDLVVRALTTGVKATKMKYLGQTVDPLIQANEAVDHALRSVPGALDGLTAKIDRGVLQNVALSIMYDETKTGAGEQK